MATQQQVNEAFTLGSLEQLAEVADRAAFWSRFSRLPGETGLIAGSAELKRLALHGKEDFRITFRPYPRGPKRHREFTGPIESAVGVLLHQHPHAVIERIKGAA